MRLVRPGSYIGLILAAGVAAQPMDRLAGPISASRTVRITGTHLPGIQAHSDLGLLDPSFRISQISIVFRMTDRQHADLQQLLADQQNPSSPNYHHWLSPAEYGNRFGLSPNDLSRVTKWLQSRGFKVDYIPPSRTWVVFSGAVREIQNTFKTEIHRYQVDGEQHFANTTDVSVPENLAPLITGILGLDDFEPKPAARTIRSPDFTDNSGNHYLSPDDYATIYDLKPLYASGYDGTGQSVVVIGRCTIGLGDIEQFRSRFGLSANDPQLILYPTSSDPGNSNAKDCSEAYLDVEWTGSIARNASVIYVYGTNVFRAVQYAVSQNLAPVITYSFAGCETSSSSLPSWQSIAQQANAQGITWLAASGDAGAAGCDAFFSTPPATHGLAVGVPANVPEVTAVGGTQFDETGGVYWNATNAPSGASVLNPIPETAWNRTLSSGELAASGGGISSYFSEPPWQSAVGVQSSNMRAVPDVALAAALSPDGYLYVINGALKAVGGTSAGTPSFAGMVALLNQYQVNNGFQIQAGLGNINPHLYSLSQSNPSAFHDITTGDNIVPCSGTSDCINGQFGYSAGPGYDMVTGLGSVDAYNLVTLWSTGIGSSPTITSLSPSSATAGAATFVLTVTGTSFTTGSVVQWNGSPLPTTFVSGDRLTAPVSSSLIASVAPVSITVFSGGQASNSFAFTIGPAGMVSSLSVVNQRVTIQAPPAANCSPAAITSFTAANSLVYLNFKATVTMADSLSNDWLAPDGSVVSRSSWQKAANTYCFDNAPPLDLSALSSGRYGEWQARVFDNGQLVFSLPFTVMQSGSLAQVTSQGGWDFTLDAINLGSSPAQANFSFFDDNGKALNLPFTSPPGFASGSTLTHTLNPNAQLVVESSGSASAAGLVGWGQLLADGGVNGFGIFSYPSLNWNALVPLETRNAGAYILAFDNTGPLLTGLAIANLSAQAANVNFVIRDDSGAQIGAGTLSLAAQGHQRFMLNAQYPETAGRRGTVEFDTPPGGQISVLGLRANGPLALTTIPVLANVSAGGGSLAHATFNGGFTSTFYLVNTGTASAPFTLSLFDDDGNPLTVPLTLPQTGEAIATSALTRNLAPGAMLVVQTQPPDNLPIWGSAQLSTTGAISGFEIFRWTAYGREASVPLETRSPNSFVLVFDNTNSLTTGVALANLANSPAAIPVLLRDASGTLIHADTVTLAPGGHQAFMLPATYPGAANLRGMAEFVVPQGGKISVIGLRAKPDGTLTTIPVLTK